MSYLSNGSTLRATFRLAAPKPHNADPAKSEIVAYIMDTIECGQVDAVRAFNSMRNVKSQVLVFDRVHRQWRGCDWEPDSDEAKKDLESRKFSEVRREIAQIWKAINALRKGRQRKRKQNAEEESASTEPDEETGIEYSDAFIPQINMDEANRIALIAQEKRQKELEAEQKENFRKAMMISR
jgi:hypothetical protein